MVLAPVSVVVAVVIAFTKYVVTVTIVLGTVVVVAVVSVAPLVAVTVMVFVGITVVVGEATTENVTAPGRVVEVHGSSEKTVVHILKSNV
jgi:hypothetical protein